MFFLAPQNTLTKSNVFRDLVAEVGSITCRYLWNKPKSRVYTYVKKPCPCIL